MNRRTSVPAARVRQRAGLRVVAVTLALAASLGVMAGSASGQSLEDEVRGAQDGSVVFEYATHHDVELCGDGGMNWGGSWTRLGRHRDDCSVGVAQAELRVRDGVVTDIALGPPSGGRASRENTRLGERDPQEVADFFLVLARTSSRREVAEDALMPAVIADGVTVWRELDGIVRDEDLGDDVRESAVFWLSQVEDERALDALVSILEDSRDPEIQEKAVFGISQHDSPRSTEMLKNYAGDSGAPDDIRENAIFWLGQSDGGGEYLRDLYGSVERRSLKEKIIFGVSQSGDDADAEWLIDRALDPGESTEVRKNALFWAGQTGVEASRLAGLYEDVSDHELKEQIIFALSQSSHERDAVEELMEIALDEADADLQKSALFWLGQSDDPRVPDFLLDLIYPRVAR